MKDREERAIVGHLFATGHLQSNLSLGEPGGRVREQQTFHLFRLILYNLAKGNYDE